MISLPGIRQVIYGVDFSGAKDAGRKIWITGGVIEGDVLLIKECFKAEDISGSGRDRERSLMALREFIKKQKESIIGLDFPFGIPRTLVKGESWERFVVSFEGSYNSPEEFRAVCTKVSDGKELKRFTDLEAKTPFSPYNLRLYRQTYFGIRDVLGPLIRDSIVCVLPMQKPLPDRAWVLEICPASTLKMRNLHLPYKGRGEIKRTSRERILESIQKTGVLIIKESSLYSAILSDIGGDALDSVIAAFTTFWALRNGFLFDKFDKNSLYASEGWVYV